MAVVDLHVLTGLHVLRTGYNDGFLHDVMKIRVLSEIESFDEPINISFSTRFWANNLVIKYGRISSFITSVNCAPPYIVHVATVHRGNTVQIVSIISGICARNKK